MARLTSVGYFGQNGSAGNWSFCPVWEGQNGPFWLTSQNGPFWPGLGQNGSFWPLLGQVDANRLTAIDFGSKFGGQKRSQ